MDLSKLPDSQRQELERLQKQFQEHQQKQQQQQPPAYDPFHLHQSYDPSSHAYNHSYYYNNYQDPSQPQQQYDPHYYQNYYSNSYQQQHYTQSETSNEQHRNEESGSGALRLGQVQDPYVNLGSQVNSGGSQPNVGYPGPPGISPAAAAAAVAALSQLIGAPMAGGEHLDQGRFRPPVGHTPYRGGGRRGGGPFRGGGCGNSGFRPPYTGISGAPFRGRGRRVRGKEGRHDPPSVAPSSQPESSAQANAQPPAHIAWCELCGVDCTSNELLDQHINGKRHKKNLLRSQRKRGAHQPVVQTEKDAKTTSDIGPEVHENIPENKPDEQTEVGDDNNKVETEENGNQEKKPQRKRKIKGRIRGGRSGGKRMRPTGPRNPKVVIPLVCDLCNIKCDTQEVFDRHAAGKKHMSKLKRFEGHQAMYGPTTVQALYPPNPLSQSLAPQPAYYGAPSSYPEAYIPTPYQAQNLNPQLADAPLEFGTQNSATNSGNGVQ